MNQQTKTIKIKANNGQELIQKAKEYKNSGGEWKLLERHIELPDGENDKEYLNWGIIISNGNEAANIYAENEGRKTVNAVSEYDSRNELIKIFPEYKYAFFNYGGREGKNTSTCKAIKEKDGDCRLYRYLVAEDSWHLNQIVHKWVQENKTAIQQSPNADFHSWVEIIDGQDGNMYLYVGKKNDNGGREIKIGIKKDKYFEEVGGGNAGEHLEINWDLMLITIDFAGWPLKFKEKKNNDQPVPRAIKDKILRKLDKVCLDPMGEIANAEVLKSDEISDLYKVETFHESGLWEKLATKVYRVEIEGEKIDLTQFVNGHWEDYNEIKNALIGEIKQNPSEWKIEERKTDSQTIIKHKSGRRHWGHAFKYFRENLEKTKKDWAEIKSLLEGQPFSLSELQASDSSSYPVATDKNKNLYTGLAVKIIGGVVLTGIIVLLVSRRKRKIK